MPHRTELLEIIAQTSQSTVWRGRDLETGALLAVKQHHGPPPPPALFALRHAHLVPILHHSHAASTSTLIMPWISASTLEQHGRLDAAAFDQLVRQSLDAVDAIHAAGFLHLDLKPENIFISDAGYQISDFGSAQPIHSARATLHGSIHYMAPEHFSAGTLDQRTDIYALGCVFYFALTGHCAFQGELKPQVITAHLQHRVTPLAGPIGTWIDRLMSRQPQDRPSSASAALAEYDAIASSSHAA